MVFDSKLEKDFLDKYMGGQPYSRETYKKYNTPFRATKHPKFDTLNLEFNRVLERAYNQVTEGEFIDFSTRFTYLKQDGGKLFETEKPNSSTWHFARGDVVKEKSQIAKHVASFNTFHIYNWQGMFAGIPNEIICQMPEQFKTYDKAHYYYTYDFIEERYETHLVRINLYERV